MKPRTWKAIAGHLAAALVLAACCALAAQAPAAAQRTFATPQEAAKALLAAAESFDVPAMLEILGPDGKDLVSSPDAVQDKNNAAAFAAKAKVKQQVMTGKQNPARATLVVGEEDWPFPVPIVKVKGAWQFDTKAGVQELLYRRIGSNELDAITICRGFVEAQKEYATLARQVTGVAQYAQKIISTPGKRDGLYWQNADGSPSGPISEAIARAIEEGYTTNRGAYHGYYFKVLKGQGPAAPMGEMDYVIKGVMIGGFALVAAPAEYRVTGVKTFLVGYDGVVYEKDLGPDTLEIAKKMERYNPDKTWKPTEDGWSAQ